MIVYGGCISIEKKNFCSDSQLNEVREKMEQREISTHLTASNLMEITRRKKK